MDKKKLQEEQIKTDYQEEMEDAYMSIVQAIKRTREQISYLTIKATAKAIKEGIRKVASKLKKVQYKSRGPSKEEVTSALMSTLLFVVVLIVFSFTFSTIGVPLIDALFEVGSTLTTNGVSTGITTVMMPFSYKWLLIAAMLLGRIELMTLITALRPNKVKKKIKATHQKTK